MALNGKFVINDADFSPLSFPGIGTFMAFSGNGSYRNHGGCASIPDNGPLPQGRYWIVDRPRGSWKTQSKIWLLDKATSFSSTPNDHSQWFALYRDDGRIDDQTWINGVERGSFRLHPIGPAGLSKGCITLQHPSDFQTLRRALLNTKKILIHSSALSAYGMIEVINNSEKICPAFN